MSRRILDWRQALSDLRADRAPRPDIREERLGTQIDRRRAPVVLARPIRAALRGHRAGARHGAIALSCAADLRLLVALAVCRVAGVASIVAVGGIDAIERRQADVVSEGRDRAALYRLADTPAERLAAIEDLREVPITNSRQGECEGVS